NLIDNAVKYADGTDKPVVRLTLDRRGGEITISVADNGPGIPEDRREDVVKRFVRLDASRTKPGTGLGLSLVVAVMALHGGRLELSATDPASPDFPGLTATMVFPAQKG